MVDRHRLMLKSGLGSQVAFSVCLLLLQHLLDIKSLRYLSSLTLHDRITKSLLHLHKKKKPPSISAQFQVRVTSSASLSGQMGVLVSPLTDRLVSPFTKMQCRSLHSCRQSDLFIHKDTMVPPFMQIGWSLPSHRHTGLYSHTCAPVCPTSHHWPCPLSPTPLCSDSCAVLTVTRALRPRCTNVVMSVCFYKQEKFHDLNILLRSLNWGYFGLVWVGMGALEGASELI